MRKIVCFKSAEIPNAFVKMQQDKSGFWVGYVCYEALEHIESKTPLLEFCCYQKRKKLSFRAFCAALPFSMQRPQFYPQILQDLEQQSYNQAFSSIKKELSKGNTYQVNYTEELRFESHCSGLEIFKTLFNQQKTKYACYFKSDFREILSFSPELFFKMRQDKIIFEPMKGTIKRGNNKQEDKKFKKSLKQDSKNKSENLMIVDLLRNDMSKIIRLSTLRIPRILKVLKFKTLFQMVSRLKARLSTKDLHVIFEAIFPCGSITGAPKISTMRFIKSLERRKRGVYCGALGVISGDKATFSVPIRTLTKEAHEDFYRYGVGSGIVWGSKCEEEFKELQLKAQFLLPDLDFALFETMLLYEDKVFLLHKHQQRLFKSARQLGFNLKKLEFFKNHQEVSRVQNFSLEDFFTLEYRSHLKGLWGILPKEFAIKTIKSYSKLRLTLQKNGDFSLVQTPLDSLQTRQVRIATLPLNPQNDLLYHKTTLRKESRITKHCFDSLYFNTLGALCEGARSNVALLKDDVLCTPPVRCGLLAGCLREFLLECGILKEAVLYKEDIMQAEKLYCMNALRGVLQVDLLKS